MGFLSVKVNNQLNERMDRGEYTDSMVQILKKYQHHKFDWIL